MQIRRLVATDAAAFRELRLRALKDHPEAFTSSWEEDRHLPLDQSTRRLESATSAFWGAFDTKLGLVGMAGLERGGRAKERHKGTIVAMYVAPEASSRGLGAMLIDTAIAHARSEGLQDLVLTVTRGNEVALRLYERCGFRAFGSEPRAVLVDGRAFTKIHMHRSLC
ncbi:GNAT family N-acetyltransferase [Ramlibacter rhizophilus]|uniref:GNAT family N-acetyltransferase n=1 Tax=Ramlibacter rhizophilus TaxID=1781167 RepID=A0A4Z0C2S9_9BURK|nr:GNAT family N-acetyltransferase [Ramlibacter rhizophilus]TFZ04525.1 GNAT family N-acetyltransferase [Ramlibacter rhizophilus]